VGTGYDPYNDFGSDQLGGILLLAVGEQPTLSSAQDFLESYRTAKQFERQYLEDQAFAVTMGIAAADEKTGNALMCPHGVNLTGEMLMAILEVYITTKPEYGRLP
jgi:hypothetical protein